LIRQKYNNLFYLSMTNKNSLEDVLPVSQGQRGLSARLKELVCEWEKDGIKVEGNFYYLAFKDGQPTEDEFVEFIRSQIIPFCLDRKYYNKMKVKIAENPNDYQTIHKLADVSNNLFIKAKKISKKSGEIGEIILFTMLEHFLGAPRVLSKMNLKTNNNMPVHGSDAIHMSYSQEDKSLYLYWGEAKLYGDLKGALRNIFSSVKTFHEKDENGDTDREFDLNLIERNIDLDDSEAEQAFLQFLDPYSDCYNDLKEVHACLTVWDADLYKNITEEEIPEDIFKDKYEKLVSETCKYIEEKVGENGVKHLRFHFLLLPVLKVYDIRKTFYQKLGIAFEEADLVDSDE